MKADEVIEAVKGVIKSHPEIKLAYIFGSQATGHTGTMSDFDFAFYADEKNTHKLYDLKFALGDKISRALKTDKVDIIILNLSDSPELKYNIIKDGKLFYCEEPFKVLIEPRILNEYFDFHDLLARYNLTKA
ncbi:MAG: nucleotidyltransferase domain-containing protein [Nitrospirae bacterium]|nr:nucleotidyltransferase domain-containing protein [Nitrospirota bacterium]